MKKKIGLALVAAIMATGATVFAGSTTVVKHNGKSTGKAACTCSKDAACGNACSGHCSCAK